MGVGGHRATPKESNVHHPESRSRRKGEYGLPVTQRKRITAYGLHTSRAYEGVEYASPRMQFGVQKKPPQIEVVPYLYTFRIKNLPASHRLYFRFRSVA